jgi:hypothetical protein
MGELLARTLLREAADPGQGPDEFDTPLVDVYMRRSADPELGFELRPGADATWRHTRVRIHASECRRIALEERHESSALRLAVIGDSTAFGWGVEYAESYPELVRRALEEHTARPVELLNFATPGFNCRQNRRTYELRARAARPELLIVHYDPNDSAPNAGPAAGPALGDDLFGSALLGLLRRRWSGRELLESSASPLQANPMILGFRYAGPEYEEALSELAELGRRARADGMTPLLMVFNAGLVREDPLAGVWPSDPHELERLQRADPRAFARRARSLGFRTLLHEPVAARARAAGFEVVDIYAPAQARMSERDWQSLRPLWLSKSDNHPNAEGHRFLAELVSQAFISRPAYAELLGRAR